MKHYSRARILKEDSDYRRQGYRQSSPERQPAKKLLARHILTIIALSAAFFLPNHKIETSKSEHSFQYGMVFGQHSSAQEQLLDTRCANPPPNTPNKQEKEANPKPIQEEIPFPYAKEIVEEAIELDKQTGKIPHSIKLTLEKHLMRMDHLVYTMQSESDEGIAPTAEVVAKRLKQIAETTQYFEDKKLVSLLPIPLAAETELINLTSPATLAAAQSLLKNPPRQSIFVAPPKNKTKKSDAKLIGPEM